MSHIASRPDRRDYAQTSAADAEPRTLAATSDDAVDSVPVLAAPVLAEIAPPATVAVATEKTGRVLTATALTAWADTDHGRELQGLPRAAPRLVGGPVSEIGAHSSFHSHLSPFEERTIVTPQSSRATSEQQRAVSCCSVAYPCGDTDRGPRATGYQAAVGRFADAFTTREVDHLARVGISHADPHWCCGLKTAAITVGLRRARRGDHLDHASKHIRAQCLFDRLSAVHSAGIAPTPPANERGYVPGDEVDQAGAGAATLGRGPVIGVVRQTRRPRQRRNVSSRLPR